MSNVIDLSTMVKEDLVIKMVNGDEFTIAGQVPVSFVIEISKMEEDLNKAKDLESQFKVLQKIVLKTLQLDTSKNIDMKYVEENINDVVMLKAIMQGVMEHISKTMEDENL